MKNYRRAISLLLLGAMLTTTLASCGSNEQTPGGDTTASGGADTTTVETLTGRDAVSDDLPDKDYKGTTFTLLTRTKYDYEFGATEENGDIVNDAVYKRNRTVEERFNVDIVTHAVACGWGSEATAFNTMLSASIMAGDGAFDLVAGYAATIPGIVSEGIFYNWAEVDYVNISKPWWSEDVADVLTINDKCFMLTGDLSLALWEGMTCCLFNKRLAEEFQVGDLYEIVRNGEWTFDKLVEITKDTYKDLNGDTTSTDADQFGYITDRSTAIDNLKEAFELPVAAKGADGFPEIVFKSERSIEALAKVNAFLHESGNAYFPPADAASGGIPNCKTIFSEGRGMIFAAKLGYAEDMRNMEDDFGIIPYPKYDEDQEEYHSTSLDEFSAFVIPADAKDIEMTGIITEALCAESYKQVIPVFYETALKTKAARDEESSEMIDIIRDGLTFDFGYLHSSSLNSVGHFWVGKVRNNDNNLASSFDSNLTGYNQKLEKVLEIYR